MQYIRNGSGQVIAMYEQQGTRTVLKTKHGRTVGSYDTTDNITRTNTGQFHSYGNSLSQLQLM